MTELIIEGKTAAFKKGTSFDYVVENRLFTDADAFTMSIDLPLKDCQVNREIFGYITRRDITKASITKSAILRCGALKKQGIVTVIDVDNVFVKVQFLEGRSAVNYESPMKTNYINELNLPYPSNSWVISEAAVLKIANNDIADGTEYIALPWVNAYSGNMQNELNLQSEIPQTEDPSSTYYPYNITQQYLSLQIYLLPLTKKILTAAGYTYDLSVWENHAKWKYLLVWNTLPAVWQERNFNKALPHWTVVEYLEQIEYLLGVDFDVNDTTKVVTMRTVVSQTSGVVQISNVVDEYKATISDELSKFRGNKVGEYADNGAKDWGLMSCQEKLAEYLETHTATPGYNKYEIWDDAWREVWHGDGRLLLYTLLWLTEDTHQYMTNKVMYSFLPGQAVAPNFHHLLSPVLVNAFGNPRSGQGESFELKIVPARIDDCTDTLTKYQNNTSEHAVTLDCGTYEETKHQEPTTEEEAAEAKTGMEYYLKEGAEQSTEYFDRLYVGYWKKEFAHTIHEGGSSRSVTDAADRNYNQLPVIDGMKVPKNGWMSLWTQTVRTGRVDTEFTLARTEFESQMPRVNASKVTVKWISDSIPNILSTYIIDNKRYMCEKIKTTISEDGMSQLLEGDFYELV